LFLGIRLREWIFQNRYLPDFVIAHFVSFTIPQQEYVVIVKKSYVVRVKVV